MDAMSTPPFTTPPMANRSSGWTANRPPPSGRAAVASSKAAPRRSGTAVTPTVVPRSRPQLSLQPRLSLLKRADVSAGGQIFPAAGRDHARDVGRPARRSGLGRHGKSGVQRASRRDSGEDALDRQQLTRSADGVSRTHREPGGEQRFLIKLGDKALVHVAQPV